ncbi:MAG: division/cell wall cluster transcriptional repressor MraZ [candidate division Zixibacteria bacterium RBG_16_50_21]|nr:MAG: division/cell wall cluster transcriptional repressor MraZ [candidate division Zixibacteria bacterium RBG_16_50_21]
MSAFKGSHRIIIDEKNRLSLPAKLRRASQAAVNDQFVITLGLEGCLFVFAADEWQRIEDKLRNLSFTQANARMFIRMLLSQATDAELDRQGRITLPQSLLDQAKLKKEKEALVVGNLNRIEIWNTTVWENYLKNSSQTYEQVAESILL